MRVEFITYVTILNSSGGRSCGSSVVWLRCIRFLSKPVFPKVTWRLIWARECIWYFTLWIAGQVPHAVVMDAVFILTPLASLKRVVLQLKSLKLFLAWRLFALKISMGLSPQATAIPWGAGYAGCWCFGIICKTLLWFAWSYSGDWIEGYQNANHLDDAGTEVSLIAKLKSSRR